MTFGPAFPPGPVGSCGLFFGFSIVPSIWTIRCPTSSTADQAEVVAAIDACVRDERQCPHCGTPGAVKRGRANGLRRYRCKACGKSFNALTGTPLARLRLQERWLEFTRTLSVGDTVRGSAAQCHVALTTAFRWRHRFLKAVKTTTAPLRGIVEADETYLLDSKRAIGRSIARRANAAARPPSGDCRASRCRSWSPPTAPAPR